MSKFKALMLERLGLNVMFGATKSEATDRSSHASRQMSAEVPLKKMKYQRFVLLS